MDAMNGDSLQPVQADCYGLVREEHEFLDQLVSPVVEHWFNSGDPSLSVEVEVGFPGRKFKRSGVEASSSDLAGEAIGISKHVLKTPTLIVPDNAHCFVI